ncbi:MAG: M48 family metallopeptidase [Sphaerochaetaceae bacterium]|nr:M48 family metallopeptidase [Sphaerochaetaceae bacterium]
MNLVVRKRRGQKSLRMHFDDHGTLIVSAPWFATKSQIDSFISANSAWIEEHGSKIPSHTYASGDALPFLGRSLPLYVFKGEKNVFLRDDGIYVFVRHPDNKESVKRELYRFYSRMLYSYAMEKVPVFCKRMSLEVPTIEICNAKSRWGCCYRLKKLIKLSAILACLPPNLIDMTIIHELCHLVYDGHGEDFKAMLEKYVPDIKEREKELKEISRSGIVRNLF